MIDFECPSCEATNEYEQESYFDGGCVEFTCAGCGADLVVHFHVDPEFGASGSAELADAESA